MLSSQADLHGKMTDGSGRSLGSSSSVSSLDTISSDADWASTCSCDLGTRMAEAVFFVGRQATSEPSTDAMLASYAWSIIVFALAPICSTFVAYLLRARPLIKGDSSAIQTACGARDLVHTCARIGIGGGASPGTRGARDGYPRARPAWLLDWRVRARNRQALNVHRSATVPPPL